MFFNKKFSLKKIYYRSFFGMIVIPILVVFIAAMSILNIMMRNSEVATIKTFQSNVISTLKEDIKEVSLQLTHFVYVNDGEFMETAAKTDTANLKARYEANQELEKSFQTAMIPKKDIIAGKFYMKDGRTCYTKEDIIVPYEEIEKTMWYQEAMNSPNQVIIGSYDTTNLNLTYSHQNRGEMVLVAAMNPNIQTDKSGKIEMFTLFFTTAAGETIREGSKNRTIGTTVILDSDSKPLYGNFENSEIASFLQQNLQWEQGVYNYRIKVDGEFKKYTFILDEMQGVDWKVINFVETPALTESFMKVAYLLGLVVVVLLVLFYLFSKYFLKNIVTPIHTMVEGLQQVEAGNLNLHIEPAGQSEIRTMMHSFNKMVRRLNASITESKEAQQRKHDAEIKALQSQINPHFLVNTLNSIRFMAQVSKFDGIRKMAESLITILSCSFRSNISFYSVAEELKVLDSYIYLMKIRYSDGFDVEYHVEESCSTYRIPRLLLQPIVENSIVHGFVDLEEEMGQVIVSIYKEEKVLCMMVEDNGKGMTEEEIDGILNHPQRSADDNYSIGVENVYTRLKLNFGEACEMRMESVPGEYTKTFITLPIVEESEREDEESNYS